jgi:transmembrane sensor
LRRGRAVAAFTGLALAAAVAVVMVLPHPPPPEAKPVAHGLRIIPRPERLTLADGSIAELNHGGKFEVAFTATERRVRLVAGELHVTVAQNPSRPFIVEVDGIAVRAVGTVFNVRRERDAIDVLVTEGRVQLELRALHRPRAETAPVSVASGERARVDTASTDPKPNVRPVSAAEIERELSWQGVRLEFDALPLAAVVSEFNLRNERQLAISDPEAGALRVGGTFRADQVEVFAHLLEVSFGLVVERRAEGPWLIRRVQ